MQRLGGPTGLVAVLCLSGCTLDLSYNLLDETRLLAVRADQPALPEGEEATLDALVFASDEAALTYQWEWCPWTLGSNSGFECLFSQEDLDAAELPLPALDLGTEATATFPYPVSAAFVQGFCESFLEGIPPASRKNFPDCTKAMPITVYFTVFDGDDEITAVKEIDLVVGTEETPNENPGLAGWTATLESESFDIQEGAAFVVDTEYGLDLQLEAGSEERYLGEDEAGEPLERTELLTFTWFYTGGTSARGRTGSVDDGVGLEEALTNEWTSPEDADDVELIVVARDDRGGVDWLRHAVEVTP